MNDLLTAIRRIIPLSPTDEQTVAALFKPYALAAGAFFLPEGSVCRQVGFVQSGLLRYYLLSEGYEHTYDFSAEGTFVCNYESFLAQTPSTRSIQALEPTTLWQINYADLQTLYQTLTQGERFGRLVAEQLFVDALQKLTAFYHETADQRYDSFLRLFPGLTERVPQYVVASYVGIKPQSLSRLRAKRAGKRY
jgi:CRP-like cAMP-binding protein